MDKKELLKQTLAAIDLDGKEAWDEFTDEEKKQITFFTLNRFISTVTGDRDQQEHFLLVTNNNFNKNLFSIISAEPKLTWLTACTCSHTSKEIQNHNWISLKREKDKKLEFLSELFPNMKLQDLETLSIITSNKEIKEYCENLGWDKKQISKIKF